jgi:hypothetical protein
MSERPRPPDNLPARNGDSGPNGQTGPAAAAWPSADDRRALPALLASRWAVILKRFRDYMHQR